MLLKQNTKPLRVLTGHSEKIQCFLYVNDTVWSGDAAGDVHHGATREVQRTHDAQPAAYAPDPVRYGSVDQQRPYGDEGDVRSEPHPLYHGDTMYSETIVDDKRLSASRPGQGIITLSHTALNQHGDIVALAVRSVMVWCKDAHAAAEGRARP